MTYKDTKGLSRRKMMITMITSKDSEGLSRSKINENNTNTHTSHIKDNEFISIYYNTKKNIILSK